MRDADRAARTVRRAGRARLRVATRLTLAGYPTVVAVRVALGAPLTVRRAGRVA